MGKVRFTIMLFLCLKWCSFFKFRVQMHILDSKQTFSTISVF